MSALQPANGTNPKANQKETKWHISESSQNGEKHHQSMFTNVFVRGSGALKRCTLSGNLINEFKIKEPRGNGLRLMFEGIFLQAEN